MNPGGFDTSFNFGKPGSERSRRDRPEPDASLVIGILGDFCGDSARVPFAQRSPASVDSDTFEAALSAFSPSADIQGVGEVVCTAIEDFEPTGLVKRVPSLAALLKLRDRAVHTATYADAAKEAAAMGFTAASPPDVAPPAAPPDQSNPLAALLGGQARSTPPASGASGVVDSLIKQALGGSAHAGRTPDQVALAVAIEARLASLLRDVLHEPKFQAIESAWRTVHFLTSRVASGETIRLRLFDVSAAELFTGGPHLLQAAAAALGRQTGDESGGGRIGWILGLFTLDRTAEDAVRGAMLAGIAQVCGCFAVAGGSASHAGCPCFGTVPDSTQWVAPPTGTDDAEAWSDLARAPAAARLGLAAPCILLRLPYGRGGEPCDGPLAFFEEFEPSTSATGGAPVHGKYLWGCGALGPGLVLAERFNAEGWEMSTFEGGDVESLPMHSFRRGGTAEMQACAEGWLSERAMQRLNEAGLIPVLSVKGRDAVRVGFIRALNGAKFEL